jgi:hypothetical protein
MLQRPREDNLSCVLKILLLSVYRLKAYMRKQKASWSRAPLTRGMQKLFNDCCVLDSSKRSRVRMR